ncbi:MAG TPA: ABC transporter ATP-binding protein [Kiritimatiellia bacterium]|nr:ABC transporter ATP-binding protein [Kiritimatiellia bacterium]HRU71525.1 ABC transporter ATP-binding protein [Kiritimatiellia bacterium]
MAVSVTVERVVKVFGTFTALKEVSLEVQPGELFFLLGPSGCGKTTLLRCIAGFYRPESGRILIGDVDVTVLPPHRRDTGMMFQSYALWPHMTVEENVAFGLKMRKVPRTEVRRRVGEALELVHLSDRAKVRPNQLSGGQQQRVALARALVIRPRCLLLDEPLSNLDAKLRLEMRMEIRRICKQAGLTAIYVTHDQKEALSVADRLAVMRDGVVEQTGTPEEVYRAPVNRFVAGFIGEGTFIEGRIEAGAGPGVRVSTRIGMLHAARAPQGTQAGDCVTLCLRPEALGLYMSPDVPSGNLLRGQFIESVYLGEVAQHRVEVASADGGAPCVLTAVELNPVAGRRREGEPAAVWIPPEHVIVTPFE